MRDLGKVVVNIPARAGSKRVKAKNLRDLCGEPLLSYAVKCALQCVNAANVFVNSDSSDMLGIGTGLGAKEYRRSELLSSDDATGDMFTLDFIKNIQVDTLVMINHVCPLVTPQDVLNALDEFKKSDCDTLISCEETQMQTFCDGQAVNIDVTTQLEPTQNNRKIQILNWAVTIWDAASFLSNYEEMGSAYLGKNRLLFPLDPLHGLKISNEADFLMVESIMRGLNLKA
jgi:CMP-N,N'-diacetyllegionaminic acid synthase